MSIGKKFYANYGLLIQQSFMEPLKVINMNTLNKMQIRLMRKSG